MKKQIVFGIILFVGIVAILVSVFAWNYVCTATVQEAYTKQEPYTAYEDQQIPLKYEVTGAMFVPETTEFYFNDPITRRVSRIFIKNVDSETGMFSVETYFITNEGKTTERFSQYIMPGEEEEFVAFYKGGLEDDVDMDYKVIPGTKTITKPVTKTKGETAYKGVPKYPSLSWIC